jgi:hypothetical protein
MAINRAKYRRLTELYVQGTEVVLKDGSVIWVQVLNPFEKDEATHDAQLARARMVMAIKEGDEREKVIGAYRTDGREVSVEKLAEVRSTSEIGKIVDEIAADPEWKERVEIMDRSDDIMALPLEDEERKVLTKINEDYIAEVVDRQKAEYEYQVDRLTKMSEEDFIEEYADAWTDKRATAVARAEYQLTELWYAARACEGVKGEDGTWNHDACESHSLRVFDTKKDARDIPEDLQTLLYDAIAGLNMSVRDARFSDRQGSSSGSSPLPSEAAESTPSIPTATLVAAPGT